MTCMGAVVASTLKTDDLEKMSQSGAGVALDCPGLGRRGWPLPFGGGW